MIFSSSLITGNPGFLFELKTKKNCSQGELSALADLALKQISEKKYVEDMKSQGVQSITQYGIAFSGKSVEISKEEAE